MDEKQAAALRKPFPKTAIGQLPKGGTMLDYVGHAATTDRLLAVDPDWTWEPMATDEAGNPQPDAAGNLWIRLTVCGVTRIGVGDGNSMKIRIGDAIRNAAMRFGVALDLWSKEELEQGHDAEKPERRAERVKSTPPDDPWQDAPPREPGDRQVSAEQLKKMHALFGELNITERDARLLYASDVVGRALTSSNELSRREASKVIEALLKDVEQPFPEVQAAGS